MSAPFHLASELIDEQNSARKAELEADYAHLGKQLARRGLDVERLTAAAQRFEVAVPSWGVGTGGTRFARFPGPGEPRDVWEKLDDWCGRSSSSTRNATRLAAHTRGTSPRIRPRWRGIREGARARVRRDELEHLPDFPGAKHSYKFGSLTHTDAAVRAQAVEHNLHVIRVGEKLGSEVRSRSGSATAATFRARSTSARRSRATSRACARSTRGCRRTGRSSSSTSSTSRRSTRPS